MENNLEIGSPNIPTPEGLPKNDGLKTALFVCVGVMAGILICKYILLQENKIIIDDTKR
jgi:hypothetical protein